MDDLDRLYTFLTASLRENFSHLVGQSFQLGHIQAHFADYRRHRARMGFDSAADYERALMRLAAGERGYLRTEDPAVADAFRLGLTNPDPELPGMLLRQHAGAEVWLPALQATGAPQAEAPPTLDGTVAVEPPATEVAATTPVAPAPVVPAAVASAPAAPTETAAPPTHPVCHYCGNALPDGRAVTFCPHCGQNVTVRRCPACSTELDVSWRFCITCGRAMDEVGLGAGAR